MAIDKLSLALLLNNPDEHITKFCRAHFKNIYNLPKDHPIWEILSKIIKRIKENNNVDKTVLENILEDQINQMRTLAETENITGDERSIKDNIIKQCETECRDFINKIYEKNDIIKSIFFQ